MNAIAPAGLVKWLRAAGEPSRLRLLALCSQLGLSVSAMYKYTYRVKQMLHEEYLHVHPGEPGAHLPGRDDPEAISH